VLAPAFFWPLAGGRRRAVNALAVLAGAAPFLLLVISFADMIYTGWRMPFYMLLQAAYGTWSPLPVLLFLLLLAAALEIASAPAVHHPAESPARSAAA
jgi:hypothetical protein